jgi:hypothetical protein
MNELTVTELPLYQVEGELRIHDLDLAKRLGFERPVKIRELIARNAEKLKQFSILPTVGKIHEGAGRPTQEYYLNQKQAVFVCMKSETDRAFDVQADIVRVYDAHLNGQAQQLPDFNDPIAMARAWADSRERELLAEAKSRALSNDNALLNTIIDNEFGYCSILRAAIHLGISEKAFKWQLLKKATLAAGLEIKRVPSPRYDYQNLYPIKIFEQVYPQYDFSGLQPEAVANRAVKLLGGQVMVAH